MIWSTVVTIIMLAVGVVLLEFFPGVVLGVLTVLVCIGAGIMGILLAVLVPLVIAGLICNMWDSI